MKTDFSTPMTFYELIAIILAAVAIIIPIVQAIWKKWIVSAKLSFLPTGRASSTANIEIAVWLRILQEQIHRYREGKIVFGTKEKTT